MSAYDEIWARFKLELDRLVLVLNDWLARLSDEERVAGTAIFALVLLFFALRRTSKGKRDHGQRGGLSGQFVMAMILVLLVGFGVGWLFPPDGDVIQRVRDLIT